MAALKIITNLQFQDEKFSQINLKITKMFYFYFSEIQHYDCFWLLHLHQMQLHKSFGFIVQYARAVLINISSLKHSSWTFWRLHAIWNYAMVSFILKFSVILACIVHRIKQTVPLGISSFHDFRIFELLRWSVWLGISRRVKTCFLLTLCSSLPRKKAFIFLYTKVLLLAGNYWAFYPIFITWFLPKYYIIVYLFFYWARQDRQKQNTWKWKPIFGILEVLTKNELTKICNEPGIK